MSAHARCRHCDQLRIELAAALHSKAGHPAVETLKYVAPFIRDALKAGVWKEGPGTRGIEHEMRSRLKQIERWDRGEF